MAAYKYRLTLHNIQGASTVTYHVTKKSVRSYIRTWKIGCLPSDGPNTMRATLYDYDGVEVYCGSALGL